MQETVKVTLHLLTVLFAVLVGLFVCLFVFPWDRVSLHSPGCPGPGSIEQAGLELEEMHPPLPPECRD